MTRDARFDGPPRTYHGYKQAGYDSIYYGPDDVAVDGDWLDDVEERLAASEAVIAEVRRYADERAWYGARNRTVGSQRIASDLLAILERGLRGAAEHKHTPACSLPGMTDCWPPQGAEPWRVFDPESGDERRTATREQAEAYLAGWPSSVITYEPAVRRVAPDRETVMKIISGQGLGYLTGMSTLERLADALLASGVLGVPAEQRTADRETIEGALRGAIKAEPNTWRVDSLTTAVLAVLVPTDQVRAEALREAHTIISKRRGTYEAGIDLMERVDELEAEATRG